MLRNLGLLLLSTLASLLGVEVAARLEWIPLPHRVSTDASWEERWHRERRGLNPRFFIELDPDLGHIPAANLDRIDNKGSTVSTNAAHMRGRREYSLARTEAARVVAIGDSFTFGQCVDDDETFPHAIEESLANTEALNLGVVGYGQGQALLRLRRDGIPYRPDAVVFGFHATDMKRNLLGFRSYGKPRLRLEGGRLEVENVPVPSPETYVRWWRSRAWNFVRIYRASREDPEALRLRTRELSLAIVRQMAVESRARGAVFTVVHLPRKMALRSEGRFGWPFMDLVCAEAERAGGSCVSTVPRLREIVRETGELDQHFACHYSPEIYRAVGELIAEELVRVLPQRFVLRD